MSEPESPTAPRGQLRSWEAAKVLGVDLREVIEAVVSRQLPYEKDPKGRWVLSVEAVEEYRQRRSA